MVSWKGLEEKFNVDHPLTYHLVIQEIMNGKPGVTDRSIRHSRKENLTASLPDLLKGSYYANPIVDFCTVSEQLRNDYPEYYGTNICMCIQTTLPQSWLLKMYQGRHPRKASRDLKKPSRILEGQNLTATPQV